MSMIDPSTGLPAWLARQLAAQGRGIGPAGPPSMGYPAVRSQPPGQAGAGTAGAMGWLDYLSNMVNPVGSAQAADDPQLAQLRAGGSPVDPRLGGPIFSGQTPTGAAPAPPAPAAPFPPAPANPPNQFQTGGPELAAARAGPPAPAGPPNQFQTGGPELAAARAGPPAVSPAATGGAQPLQPNNRFVQIGAPNWDPLRSGQPQMTALNLAGLFNRGQPNVPAAQPVTGVLGQNRPAWANWPTPPRRPPNFGTNDSSYPPQSSSG